MTKTIVAPFYLGHGLDEANYYEFQVKSFNLTDLFFHLLNVLFSRFNLLLQLFDLVVQHELELLQLLILLLQVVDPFLLQSNRLRFRS